MQKAKIIVNYVMKRFQDYGLEVKSFFFFFFFFGGGLFAVVRLIYLFIIAVANCYDILNILSSLNKI